MLEVVYIAFPGQDVRDATRVLHGAGLHPVALDDPDPDYALMRASGHSLRIRIAVPEEEVPAAVRALRLAGQKDRETTRELTRQFERGAVFFLLGAAVLAGLIALGYRFLPDFPWIILAFIGLSIWVTVKILRRND